MGAGKIITIIGGISGLLSTILFHVFPNVFCLWRLDVWGFANLKVWIGGFGFRSGEYYTNGGRVVGICASEENLNKTLDKIYKAISGISFEGMHFRKDIGAVKEGEE